MPSPYPRVAGLPLKAIVLTINTFTCKCYFTQIFTYRCVVIVEGGKEWGARETQAPAKRDAGLENV